MEEEETLREHSVQGAHDSDGVMGGSAAGKRSPVSREMGFTERWRMTDTEHNLLDILVMYKSLHAHSNGFVANACIRVKHMRSGVHVFTSLFT